MDIDTFKRSSRYSIDLAFDQVTFSARLHVFSFSVALRGPAINLKKISDIGKIIWSDRGLSSCRTALSALEIENRTHLTFLG